MFRWSKVKSKVMMLGSGKDGGGGEKGGRRPSRGGVGTRGVQGVSPSFVYCKTLVNLI